MNSKKYLDGCFNSIIKTCENEHVDYEIIVVDNNSVDGSHEIYDKFKKCLKERFKVILLDNNYGTTTTRNIALKGCYGNFICILDSDTELIKVNISELLNELETNLDLGIIAPRLLLSDDSIQNSVKKYPTFLVKLSKMLKIILKTKQKDYDFYADFPFKVDTCVDTAISACWFFRRDLLKSVGYLDEKIFYSPEDVDYCLRVNKAGLKVKYKPSVSVRHFTQQVSHKAPFSKISLSHFAGLVYYFYKHGGWLFKPRINNP
jgi:GT2 family glycosyltransferase